MGRYYYSKKRESDSLKKLTVFDLKRYKLLNWYSRTNISWIKSWDNSRDSITVEVSIDPDDMHIRLIYKQTDYDTEEQKKFDYKIPLVRTLCNFGNYRYWFRCPWNANGIYCGRRVGALYKDGDYFACRHCYNLTYHSRNQTRSVQMGFLSKIMDLEAKEENLYEKVKKHYYKGQLTKNARRLESIRYRLSNCYMSL